MRYYLVERVGLFNNVIVELEVFVVVVKEVISFVDINRVVG